MPVPAKQLQRLRVDLQEHEERLADLQSRIQELKDESIVHQTLLTLGRDDKVLNLLHEVYDRPELASDLSRSPSAYLKKRGVKFPRGTKIKVAKNEQGAAVFEAHIKQGSFNYKIVWDPQEGFSLAQIGEDVKE
jgi:hypothetical protein